MFDQEEREEVDPRLDAIEFELVEQRNESNVLHFLQYLPHDRKLARSRYISSGKLPFLAFRFNISFTYIHCNIFGISLVSSITF